MKEDGLKYLETKKCPICKKHFTVLYPHLWRYKNQNTYFCSWKCLRVNEKEGENSIMTRMKKDGTPAKKTGRKPATEPKTLGDVLENCAKAADEFFGACEDMGVLKPEKVSADKQKEKDDAARAARMAIIDRVNAMHMGEERTYAPVEVMGHPVRAIEIEPFGLFFYDHKHKWIDWTTAEGEEISMTPQQWWDFAYSIPEMFAILGVDPHEKSHS